MWQNFEQTLFTVIGRCEMRSGAGGSLIQERVVESRKYKTTRVQFADLMSQGVKRLFCVDETSTTFMDIRRYSLLCVALERRQQQQHRGRGRSNKKKVAAVQRVAHEQARAKSLS